MCILSDPDGTDYADQPKTTTKSIFKPMSFVRAGESAPVPVPVPSATKIDSKPDDSDEEEDVMTKNKLSRRC